MNCDRCTILTSLLRRAIEALDALLATPHGRDGDNHANRARAAMVVREGREVLGAE